MAPVGYREWALYKRLLRHVRPYWPHVVGIFLLSLVDVPMALLAPLPLKMAVDGIAGGPPTPAFLDGLVPAAFTRSPGAVLTLAACLIVALGLLKQVHTLVSSLLHAYTAEKLVLDLRGQLFRHVQRLSFSYHDEKGVADSTYRIQQDASSIQGLILDAAIPLISTGITFVVMIYVAARIDMQLLLLVLVLAPILALLTQLFRSRCRRQWTEVKTLESSAWGVMQEALSAARVVKAFGQEEREHRRYFRQALKSLRARLRATLTEGVYSFLTTLVNRVGMATVLVVAGHEVVRGALTLGDLVLLMAYLGQIIVPLNSIGKTITGMQSGLAGAQRAFVLLDEAPDVPEHPDARPLARAAGRVAFREVSFAYEGDHAVLSGVSFEVPAGARLGIRGRTGAGKTTLLSLLTRFYDPKAGQILLDGVDLRDYKLADLRNQFGIVLQDPLLFSTSIAENIAYARPTASREEVVRAAQAAGAHDFITRLPEGYDTPVGERGMRLSGGERQRISLARAFLKDAPILLLDEPTSSVDVGTEVAIMEAMERLMRGRTTFLISHRPSTLESCDLSVEIEHGEVVQVSAPSPDRVAGIKDRATAAATGEVVGAARGRDGPVQVGPCTFHTEGVEDGVGGV